MTTTSPARHGSRPRSRVRHDLRVVSGCGDPHVLGAAPLATTDDPVERAAAAVRSITGGPSISRTGDPLRATAGGPATSTFRGTVHHGSPRTTAPRTSSALAPSTSIQR